MRAGRESLSRAPAASAQRASGTRAPLSFALRFALIAGALFALYAFPYASYGIEDVFFPTYLAAYAELVGAALRLLDTNVAVVGNTITGAVSLQIVRTCDAMEATILLASALAAFPGPLARKAVALVAGLLVLSLANVLRIATLYYVLRSHPNAFEFFHLELWPLLLIAIAGVSFLAGIRFLRKEPANAGA